MSLLTLLQGNLASAPGSISLTSAAIAIATATGVISQSLSLGGSAAALSIANGTATVTTTLSGAALSSAAATGSITVSMALSGSAIASALASANLAGPAGISLAGLGVTYFFCKETRDLTIDELDAADPTSSKGRDDYSSGNPSDLKVKFISSGIN